MRLYISGPMSGYKDDNFDAFNRAEDALRGAGYMPINPARGSKPISQGRTDDEWYRSGTYQTALSTCLDQLRSAKGLVQLPGWTRSHGARIEHRQAHNRMGIPCGTVEEWIKWDLARCIRWKGDPGCAPVRQYEGDAGFDLTVSETTLIHVGRMADVPLGINIELPTGVWAMLTGRSSTVRKRGILVVQGIIDQGYRGPLFAACHNLSDCVVEVHRGERVAQLIPIALISTGLGVRRVEKLARSERGEAAFGSTGGFAGIPIVTDSRVPPGSIGVIRT